MSAAVLVLVVVAAADGQHPTRSVVETVAPVERIRHPPLRPRHHPTSVNQAVAATHATRPQILLVWMVVVSVIAGEEVEVRRGDCSAKFNIRLESFQATFALLILLQPLIIIVITLRLLLNVLIEQDQRPRQEKEVVVCQKPFIVMQPLLDQEVITFMVLIMRSHVPRLPREGEIIPMWDFGGSCFIYH